MPTPLRCDPNLFSKDLKDQVIIVTGANSGCGLETTRQLCKQGATVVLACRNKERGEAAAKDMGDKGVFIQLDLASLQSVRDFVSAFKAKYDRLDVLVNNAGIMACPLGRTKEGFEMQIGCNHLGHFFLFCLLAPLLEETGAKNGKPSKVVALSSVAATEMSIGKTYQPKINFEDMNWETRKYDEWVAYQESKLANYLLAVGASKKYDPSKIMAFSVHPGWVRSNLDQHALSGIMGTVIRKIFTWKGDMISTVDGAQSTLHCVLEDSENLENGGFYSQFGVYKDKACRKGGWPLKLPNPNATPEAAEKLWEVSEEVVGLKK